jgi:hypothetical protein
MVVSSLFGSLAGTTVGLGDPEWWSGATHRRVSRRVGRRFWVNVRSAALVFAPGEPPWHLP